MPDNYRTLDPAAIVSNRDVRQRRELTDLDGLKESIKSIGLINPIVVRHSEGVPLLVAGERRLKACLELGLTAVPVRYFEELDEEEAQIIELEENVKRQELPWRDHVKAVGQIHELYRRRQGATWRIDQTAAALSIHHSQLRKILHVYGELNTARLANATGIEQAYSVLQRLSERKAESIVSDIIAKGAAVFAQADATATADDGMFTTLSAVSVAEGEEQGSGIALTEDRLNGEFNKLFTGVKAAAAVAEPPPDPVKCLDFIEWIKSYSGPKFSLIHCDFPYGNYQGNDSLSSANSAAALDGSDFYADSEDIYWSLLAALCANLERVMSYSAHMMFWFSMTFYSKTKEQLNQAGLQVLDRPLVWHKSDGSGVIPAGGIVHPRNTYETAFLCVRGSRPLAKVSTNSYGAPTAQNKLHPSQKPEPVLRHFFNMLVDETTSMLDPTCGSGTALRAAEDLGAKTVLGLEMDPNYAAAANAATIRARLLRSAGV